MSVKVSIIMPSFNVAPYIRECMDSVVNPSLKDIEIIVVDAFSTDGTREILEEYAENDNRIRVLDDDKGSTGYSNNKAIDAASGEYIGIVETDDFISSNMYEKLYNIAKEYDCDIVKGDYESFSGNGDNRLYVHHNMLQNLSDYDMVINPVNDRYILDAIMFNWAGIYRKSFLEKYNIRHQETPGASFQDNGFFVQAFVLAERVYFTHQSFYRYRRDNPNSSINNPNKVFCMCDEYDYAENMLSKHEDRLDVFMPRILRRRYGACSWTLKKVNPKFREQLTERMHQDFRIRIKNLDYIKEIQPKVKYQREMELLLTDKDRYLEELMRNQERYAENIARLCKRLRKYDEIVIFGAGEEGNTLRDILAENGIAVACITDNDRNKWGMSVNGTRVYSPNDCMKRFIKAYYVIAMHRNTHDVRCQLVNAGISNEMIYTYQSWRFVWD